MQEPPPSNDSHRLADARPSPAFTPVRPPRLTDHDNFDSTTARASKTANSVLIELFTGGAGATKAFELTGHAHEATCMFENGAAGKTVVPNLRHHHPNAVIWGDVNDLINDDFKLLLRAISQHHRGARITCIGGFPCQDTSRANRHGKGLRGPRSSLFAVMAIAIRWLQDNHDADVIFIAENVLPRQDEWRLVLNRIFGVDAILINAGDIGPTTRERLYWTNVIGIKPPNKQHVDYRQALDPGWQPWHDAAQSNKDSPRWPTFTRPFGPGGPPEWPSDFTHLSLRSYTADNLVIRTGTPKTVMDELKHILEEAQALQRGSQPFDFEKRGALATYIHKQGNDTVIRPLNGRERARALGYDYEHLHTSSTTPTQFSEVDWQVSALMGNGFSVPVIHHIVNHFAEKLKLGQHIPIQANKLPSDRIEDIHDAIGQVPESRP